MIKLAKKKSNTIVQAILINIALFVLLLLLFEPTTKIDDYHMLNVLYGGYNGEYSPFILFSNPIYGYILCALLHVSPAIPWYFIVQYILMLWALIEITFILLKKNNISIWILVILLSYIYYEFFIRITFSKTAGLLIASGYLLLFYLIESTEKISLPLLRCLEPIGLIIFGVLIRQSIFLMVSVIIASGLIVYIIRNRKATKKKLITKCCVFVGFAVLLLCLYNGLVTIGKNIYKSDVVWNEYLDNNSTRVALFDYGFPDYNTYKEDYEKLGVSYSDYQMWAIANWRDDPDNLSFDKMSSIRKIANHSVNVSFFDQFENSWKNLLSWCFNNTMFYFFLCCCILLFVSGGSGRRYVVPIVFAACLVAYFYLYYRGRTQHHVDAVIFVAGALLCLYHCKHQERRQLRISIIALCLLGMCFILSFYKQLKSSSYMGTSFGNYSSQKEQYEHNRSQNQLLVDDADHLYLYNAKDASRIFQSFTVWETIPQFFYHNLHLMNMDHIPIHKNVLKDFDVTNPIMEIVNSHTIYCYVSIYDKEAADIIWHYIQEHVDESASKVLVKNTELGNVYRFWTQEFTIDETSILDNSNLVYEIDEYYDDSREVLTIKGYLFENGTDSFAQNIYIKVSEKNTPEDIIYMTRQTLNKEYEDEDKYNGKYSGFSKSITLPESESSDYTIFLVLENENGVYELPLDIS